MLDVMRRVRMGEEVGILLQSLQQRASSKETSTGLDRREKQVLLLSSLMQGTDAFPEIGYFLDSLVNNQLWIRGFNEADFDLLRNRVFNARALGQMIESAAPIYQIGLPSAFHKASARQTRRQTIPPDESLDAPLAMLPAAPWTRVTADGLLVSRLVTLFLNYQNTYWRYLEADIFLQAMKMAQPSSDFCSPFLVNSVLAMASVCASHNTSLYEILF